MTKQQRLPSDALKRTNPVKVAIIAAAAVVLVAGLGTAAFAIGPSLRAGLNHPTATATAAPVDAHPTLSPDELAAVQGIAETQQAKITADAQAAAQAAADAAAAQAAAQKAATQKSTSTKHPSGTPLPFIPSTDPQNANGGDYEDPSVFCQSGSASTVNGVPTCD